MSKLLILRGIPASGKSTFARQWVEESPDTRVRINRDDIRFQLFGKYWRVDEGAVTIAQDSMLRSFLKKRDVVLDNTNLARSYVVKVLKIAAEAGAEVEFKDFPIHVEDAVERDSQRERQVGAEVIRQFAQRYYGKFQSLPPIPTLDNKASMRFEPYVYTEGLPSCIIVDIDGTLAHMDGKRSPYDPSKYHLDRFDEVIGRLSFWYSSAEQIDVIVLSGRDETYRDVTARWLRFGKFNFYKALYMRPAGDTRNDAIVKNELFEEHIAGKYNVDFILDDRDRVVQMWRSKGLKCLQVADGKF